jgi:hypothetical protein
MRNATSGSRPVRAKNSSLLRVRSVIVLENGYDRLFETSLKH